MPKYFLDINNDMDNIMDGGADHSIGNLMLDGDIKHHLKKVIRVHVGDEVILCDGRKTDYKCTVATLEPLILHVKSKKKCLTEPKCKITLYQAMPKADKMDWIVQKAVELGVNEIVPIYTEHCVAKPVKADRKAGPEKKRSDKIERYQKIAQSAAGQSMRGIIPIVHTPLSWSEAIERATEGATRNAAEDATEDATESVTKNATGNATKKSSLQIVAHEKEKQNTIKSVFEFECKWAEHSSGQTAPIQIGQTVPTQIGLWIGPEGGFSDSEIKAMQEKNFKPVSLGPRILRTETAAIAALAQIIFLQD